MRFSGISIVIFAVGVAGQTCPSNGTSTSVLAKPPGVKPQNIPKGCAGFEIVIARGTGEYDRNTTGLPPGKFGIVVGDPLVDGVVKVVPTARGYPVQYPASLSGADQGRTDTVKRLKQLDKECPNMKFAIVGYSQGAAVMHSADKYITGEVRKKVVAAVMFGDPSYSSATFFSGIPTMNVCNTGNSKILPDPICSSSKKGFCFDAHTKYMQPQFMGPATEFMIRAFKGTTQKSRRLNGNEAFTPDPALAGPASAAPERLHRLLRA